LKYPTLTTEEKKIYYILIDWLICNTNSMAK